MQSPISFGPPVVPSRDAKQQRVMDGNAPSKVLRGEHSPSDWLTFDQNNVFNYEVLSKKEFETPANR